jgi:hypothetical protein
MRNIGRLEQGVAHGRQHEEGNEQADAAIGNECSSQHDGKHGALGAQALGQILGDGLNRTAGFHQLAEQRAKQKDREKLRDKAGRVAHESLGPVCQQRLACQQRSNQGTQRREKQNGPAPIGKPDQQTERDQDSGDAHHASSSQQARSTGKLIQSALRQQHIEIGARLTADICSMTGQELVGALSALCLQHREEFPFGVEL